MLGKPDLFVTFTCNPRWEKIKKELLPHQNANDRPDIFCRVFRLQLKELLYDLYKRSIFGRVIGRIHVIEFQKRGLPHAHILLILDRNSKIKTADHIDQIISAEIPDKAADPELYSTVITCMMHNPCHIDKSCSCLENGKCTKKYPKMFQTSTDETVEGYPVYRRRDDGRFVDVKGIKCDNRYKFYLKN